MRFYDRGGNGDAVATRIKPDQSPVTEADLAAEAVILAALETLTPTIPVIAEERIARGHCPDLSGGVFWLVDPLDGTKEFLNRTGEFSVNIGLVCHDGPTFGLIYAPLSEILYVTDQAGGAVRQTIKGERARLGVREPDATGLDVLISRSHADGRLDSWLAPYAVRSRTAVGSALKFCRIAEGQADLYLRTGPTSEWDTAAGQAILEAAGGVMVNLDQTAFRYGKTGFLNDGFIASNHQIKTVKSLID